MASTHNRAIEDRILNVCNDMREYEGISLKSVTSKCGISDVARWRWFSGQTFPKSLSLLRTLVEACGGRLRIKIVAKDGEEWLF